MNLASLMKVLDDKGIKAYGDKLWEVETECGRHLLPFDGDNAIIEVEGRKRYAQKTKDAVVAEDGTVEIYTAIAKRDYSGTYEGREFNIVAGEIRVFWR